MSDREMTSLELVEAFERESGAFDGPSVNVSPPHPGIVPTWPRLIRERALAEAAPLDGLREARIEEAVCRSEIAGSGHATSDIPCEWHTVAGNVHVARFVEAFRANSARDEGETT